MGGILGGKKSTISHSENRINALQIQQSTYGTVIPVVFGTNRLAGNLIDYIDFTAIPHTTTTHSGGKGGGGVTSSETTYTYTVAAVMSLCEGPIVTTGKIWKDKEVYENSNKLGMSIFIGDERQKPWNYFLSKHPERALYYPGTAYIAAAALDLGNSGSLPGFNFEVAGKGIYKDKDALPRDIIAAILSDAQIGVGFPAEYMDTFELFNTYCIANKIAFSPVYTAQTEAQEIITDLCKAANAEPVWSQGRLKIIPYGLEEITANGVTYKPPIAPVYDLTLDDFVYEEGESAVKIKPNLTCDRYNIQSVEIMNRANDYNVEPIKVSDDPDVAQRGPRQGDAMEMHFITTVEVGQFAAQSILQRELYVPKQYEFTLTFRHALLDPMDVVTITELDFLGLDKVPVRIISIEEQDDFALKIVAEDCPDGVNSPALYATQPATRPTLSYNIDPGNINDPVIFEAPPEITQSGLETWIAVSGGEYWGGCTVWASDSGDTYKRIGSIHGPARMGKLTAPLAAYEAGEGFASNEDMENRLSVELTGGDQLISGSVEDAKNLNTLCIVGDEIMSYAYATLTDIRHYDLNYLMRGAYQTQNTAHLAGTFFLRLDNAIFKYPFDKDKIGKPLHLKFTSFNIYNSGEQSLADVKAYTHVLSAQPPPKVNRVVIDEDTYVLRDGTVLSDILVTFDEPSYAIKDHYNIYYNLNDAGWQYAGMAQSGSYRIKALPQAKNIIVKVTTVNRYGFESSGALSGTYKITGKSDLPPEVTGLTLTPDEYNRANILLKWDSVNFTEVPDIKGYEVRLGEEWDTATKISNILTLPKHAHVVPDNGSYTFMVKSIDNSGNYAKNPGSKTQTFFVVPDAPTDLTYMQEPKDRTMVTISWIPSPGKDIAGYELRYGGGWETGTRIGFTQEASYVWNTAKSGTYNVMVKAKTVAGHMSIAANLIAAIFLEAYDVTGFGGGQSTTDRTQVHLKWDEPLSLDISHYEIRVGASWDTGLLIGQHITDIYFDTQINEEKIYTYWIKAVSVAGKYSLYPTKLECIFDLNPAPVTNIVLEQDENDRSLVNVSWTGIKEIDLLHYEIRYGWTWETAKILVTTANTNYQFRPDNDTGNVKVMIKSVNTAQFYSDETSASLYVTLEPQAVENFIVQQNGEYIELYWDRANEHDVVGFEIREGWTFDYGALIATNVTGNNYRYKVDFEGVYHYWIKAINRSNKYSAKPADQELLVVDLPEKNIVQSFDEIITKDGIHHDSEFAPSEINWQTIGGRWPDYPTTTFEEVGGRQVLKLLKKADGSYPAKGVYECKRIDVGKVITANISLKFLSTVKFRGDTTAVCQMRVSKDAVTWTVWKDFLPAKFVFRYIELRVNLATANKTKTPEVNRFDLIIDLPDIEKAGTLKVPIGGSRINYDKEFYIEPIVTPYAIGSGIRVEVTSRDKKGFNARVLNLSGTDVGGTIDWRARGY